MDDLASMHLLRERGRLSRGQCLALVLHREREQIIDLQHFEAQFTLEKHYLLSIRYATNTFRLPSLLPDELLADIMCLAYGFDYRDESFWVESWRPIWLSHVCTQWRRVALATPRLWSNVPLGYPNIRDVFLSRKGNAPVDVKMQSNVSLSTRTSSRIAQIVQDCAVHLRSVQLKLHDRHDLLAIVRRLVQRPLPQLLHLRLELFSNVQGQRSSGQLSQILDIAPLPLCYAGFRFLPIPLASPLLRGGELREMKIAHQNFLEINDLLEVFRLNPRLVELHLIDIGLVSDLMGFRRRDRVQLGALKLMVAEDVSEALELLGIITTSASIRIAGSTEQYPELAELLIDEHRSFQGLRAFEDTDIVSAFVRHRTMRSTDVQEFSNRVEFSISLYPAAFSDGTDDSRDHPQLEMNLVHPIYGSWGALTFRSIGGPIFPLSNLQHLHFYGVHNIVRHDRRDEKDLQLWNNMFSSLRSLRGLVLDRSTFYLPMVSLANEEEGADALRCPRLQSISITITSLVDSAFESPANTAHEGFASLIACVLKRHAKMNDHHDSELDTSLALGLRTLSVRMLELDANDEGRSSTDHAIAFMTACTSQLDALARRVVCHCEEEMEGNSHWQWEF